MRYLLLFESATATYEAESILRERGYAAQVVAATDLPEDVGDECGGHRVGGR